jgi:dephospho-CoA kinase
LSVFFQSQFKPELADNMNIAITGTVGSGKSGVAGILAGQMRIQSLDTDVLCRKLLEKGQAGWNDLIERWGDTFLDENGDLDRVRLREVAFSEPEVRKGLEQILHARVREAVSMCMQSAAKEHIHLLVEVPLLFEAKWQSDFDHVVTVYAPSGICIDRTVQRDSVSREQAESILALQLSPEEKAERADSVIDNSGVWGATVLQVSLLSRKLQELGLE